MAKNLSLPVNEVRLQLQKTSSKATYTYTTYLYFETMTVISFYVRSITSNLRHTPAVTVYGIGIS